MATVQLEVGKLYKDIDDNTIDIYVKDEDGLFHGIWVEQALEEPNHASILYNAAGQMCMWYPTIQVVSGPHIVREVTELENARIKKLFETREGAQT